MKRITSRFMMLIATAAVLPLIVYGVVSMGRLRQGTETSVREGNLELAEQVASQVKLYIDNNARVLRSVGQEISSTSLAPWQQTRILTNHVLEFRGVPRAHPARCERSHAGDQPPRWFARQTPTPGVRSIQGVHVADVFVDDDALPTTDLSLRLSDDQGWLVGRLSLEELWRFVDTVRVGQEGFALVFSADRRLIAHGDPAKKRLVASAGTDQGNPPAEAGVLEKAPDTAVNYYDFFPDERNGRSLATMARVPELNWTAMVVQPTSEAFAVYERDEHAAARRHRPLAPRHRRRRLGVGARLHHAHLRAHARRRRRLPRGDSTSGSAIGGSDEIHQLGDAVQLDGRSPGRAAGGRQETGTAGHVRPDRRRPGPRSVAPDPEHRQQLQADRQMFDDLDYRETFKRTVDREMVMIKRVLDDLRNIARPIPLERFPLEINRSVAEAVESMQQHAETAGVTLQAEFAPEPLVHRRRRLRARPRLSQPGDERHPGDRAGRADHRRDRSARRPRPVASTTPAAAFRPIG